MDAKITKVRLNRMLSYDWLKMVGAAAALIFVWVMVFTMTATRIQPAQQFVVANYFGNNSIPNAYTSHLNKALREGGFTDEVLEIGTADLALDDSVGYQLLEARVATNELDAMLVSSQPNPSTAYEIEGENGEKTTAYKQNYLESFLGGYRWRLHKLNLNEGGYFKNMELFLNKYFTAGYEDVDSLNEELVEKDFRARAARTKDKRYKREEKIQKGIQEDIARLKKYAKALKDFYAYLDAGYIQIVESSYTDEETPSYSWTESYAINICPAGATNKQKENLVKLMGYKTTYLNEEEGKEQTTISADNMNICLFDLNGSEEMFDYEGLVYVCYLMESVLS